MKTRISAAAGGAFVLLSFQPAFCNESDGLLKQGDNYEARGRFVEAIELYNRAIKADPANWKALLHRGHVYRRLKRMDAAISDLDRVVALNPRCDEAFYEASRTHEAMLDDEAAIRDLTAAIAINPKNFLYLKDRAGVYENTSRNELAIDDLLSAGKIASIEKDSDVQRILGRLYLRSGQAEKAVICNTKALAVAPEDKLAYCQRADAYLALKKYREAVADYSVALKQKIRPELYVKRARAYRGLGDARAAAADEKSAAALSREAFDLAPFSEQSAAHRK